MTSRKSSASTSSVHSALKLRPMTDIPSVSALRDKVLEFENAGIRLLSDLHEAATLHSRFGQPTAIDFPAWADRRRATDDAIRSKYSAAGEECPALPTSAWCEFLEGFPSVFTSFHALGIDAIKLSEPLEFVVDSPDTAVGQRMVPQLIRLLRQAMSHVHASVYGEDGMGFFRLKESNVPASFGPALQEVAGWRMQIEAAKQPPPLRRANGWSGVDLKKIGGIKDGVFIRMCEKACVKRAKSGNGVAHRFTRSNVIKLIAVGRASRNSLWIQAADSWAHELYLE